MEIIILSPTVQKIYHAAWIEFETPVGNFVVQKGHAPAILPLQKNSQFMIWLKSGKQEVIDVQSGSIKITRGGATVLLDQ